VRPELIVVPAPLLDFFLSVLHRQEASVWGCSQLGIGGRLSYPLLLANPHFLLASAGHSRAKLGMGLKFYVHRWRSHGHRRVAVSRTEGQMIPIPYIKYKGRRTCINLVGNQAVRTILPDISSFPLRSFQGPPCPASLFPVGTPDARASGQRVLAWAD
jgi:hypothetical protein